ncbi:hypothetical protein E7V67_003670 [[Empedobacter] haloabium]|uniref:Uncharacterized protein n=1 Tax=[Empedobacter] haloabium TaxID=592317 RepID=A0ABZ1UNV2_9BURK
MTQPEIYPQDDLGGTLSVPAGAENVPPMRLAALEAPASATAPATTQATAQAAAPQPERASLAMKLVVGAAVAVCAGMGMLLWLRPA